MLNSFLNPYPCSPLSIISSNNSPWTSGIEETTWWGLVSFWSDGDLELLNNPGSSLSWFSFHDAPDVSSWGKFWTAGRTVQQLDSSPVKSCCSDGCSMWFSIVLLKYGKRRRLDGSRCCSETCMNRSAVTSPFQMFIPQTLLHLQTSRNTGCWNVRW